MNYSPLTHSPMRTAMEDFGPYQLIEKIAEGGMAEIYLARSSKVSGVEKYLIIKRILDEYSHSQKLMDLFINEAKINMNMSHPNVVSIFDFGLINGRFFMAMDFVRGPNMYQLLKKVRHYKLDYPDIYDMVYIVSQAAKGLSYAHRCKNMTTDKPLNIIHKDISPDNIMIDCEGAIKIIDFGIAAITTEHKSNAKDGKFSYMSPEQALGLNIDQKTDIFSLGIVLWELLAQRKLYNGKTLDEVKDMARNARVTCLKDLKSDLSQDLLEIIDKSLKKIPKNRHEDMAAFQNDLKSFLNKHCPSYSTENLQTLVNTCYHEQNKHFAKLVKSVNQGSSSSSLSSKNPQTSQDSVYQEDSTTVSMSGEVKKRQFYGRSRQVKRRRIRKIRKA